MNIGTVNFNALAKRKSNVSQNSRNKEMETGANNALEDFK